MANVEIPVINLNGSSPEGMVKDIMSALHALLFAIDAVAETAPHPRDWQTAKDGDALFRLARAQHEVRLRKLNEVHAELEAIGLGIQEQADRRRA